MWISTSTVLGVQSISLVLGGVESNHHQEAAMEDRKLTREEIALRILSGLIAGYAGGGGQSTKFSSAVDKMRQGRVTASWIREVLKGLGSWTSFYPKTTPPGSYRGSLLGSGPSRARHGDHQVPCRGLPAQTLGQP